MPLESIIAVFGILSAAAWSPGPNNAMLAASGATFGLRRSLPHALGVGLGFPLMLFLVALGLGRVFERFPALHEILRWAGAALLLWVAWRIATATGPGGLKVRARPFTAWQAAGFQWINPKAWVMTVSIGAQFVTGAHAVREALVCTLVAVACALSSALGWAVFGTVMGRWLADPARLRLFNGAMAGLIVLAVVYLVTAPA